MEIKFNEFLNEKKNEKKPKKYDCIMLASTDVDEWEKSHLSQIDEDDLYIDEDDVDEYGYCDMPHVTLL